jgi:hypothetical protein|tara:strand:+ start:2710 stop:2898 length:189 start_codon:yes stop_codon:yes gene_type:complete
MDDLKLYTIVFVGFLVMFLTSLLLELSLFKNLIRQVLVVLFMLVELSFIVLIFKDQFNDGKN